MRPYKLLIVVAALLPFLLHFAYTYSKTRDHHESGLVQKILLGNQRFASDVAAHPHMHARYTRQIAKEQHPHAVVIACSDSRVSPEIVFDEGLGDLFVIRTAGNIIGENELGSVEYAVEHLQVPLVIVMGHERCGAVQAMVSGLHPGGHLQSIIDSLQNEEEIRAIPFGDAHRLDHCITANIHHGIKTLTTQSEMIQKKLDEGSLRIVGAYYDLDNRKVKIIQ
jgi:carbonic anhydrase